MASDATARRRWFGAFALLGALGMLICGMTVLEATLRNLAFLLYWLVCFALTGLAVLIALLDVRAIQRRAREHQRDLFESALKKVETKAKAGPRNRDRRPRGA